MPAQRQPLARASTPTSSATCRSRSRASASSSPTARAASPTTTASTSSSTASPTTSTPRSPAASIPRSTTTDLPGTVDDAGAVPDHPDLARDRLAQRRAAGERRLRRGARPGRRQHRGIRRLAGQRDPASARATARSETAPPETPTAAPTTADAAQHQRSRPPGRAGADVGRRRLRLRPWRPSRSGTRPPGAGCRPSPRCGARPSRGSRRDSRTSGPRRSAWRAP